jgi:glycosyltransferase involved in cell wall biosynthesis
LSVAPVVIAARAGVPLVQTLHDYELISANAYDDSGHWVDTDEARFDYRLLNTATFQVRWWLQRPRINEYVAISEFVAEAHRRRGIESTVIPNATTEASAARDRGARHGVFFAGKLIGPKGVKDLVDVAEAARELRVFVAGDGPLRKSVQRAAEHIPNLVYLGFLSQEDVEDRLKSSVAALMPSSWAEPSGLVALEAMAVGTPVVTYRRGGLGEMIQDAQAGFAVPPDRGVDGLVEACRTLARDSAAWHAASSAGRQAVGTRFSLDTWVERIEAVYRRAAQTTSDVRRQTGSPGPQRTDTLS